MRASADRGANGDTGNCCCGATGPWYGAGAFWAGGASVPGGPACPGWPGAFSACGCGSMPSTPGGTPRLAGSSGCSSSPSSNGGSASAPAAGGGPNGVRFAGAAAARAGALLPEDEAAPVTSSVRTAAPVASVTRA